MEISASTEAGGNRATDVAWKQLYGHVFKAPAYPTMFSCFVGAGAQLFLMFYVTLCAFVFFFTTYSLRPKIYIITMGVLALMGFVNGLVTCRFLKFFGLSDWVLSAVIASVAFPAMIYLCIGIETLMRSFAGGYRSDSFWKTIVLTLIWCAINCVSCAVGAYKGYCLPQVQTTHKPSSFAREIPPQPKLMNMVFIMIVFGGV